MNKMTKKIVIGLMSLVSPLVGCGKQERKLDPYLLSDMNYNWLQESMTIRGHPEMIWSPARDEGINYDRYLSSEWFSYNLNKDLGYLTNSQSKEWEKQLKEKTMQYEESKKKYPNIFEEFFQKNLYRKR